MSLIESVTTILQKASQPYQAGRFVIVPTLLCYEGGCAVQAYIEGGVENFVVSDGGCAATNFVSLGGDANVAQKHIKAAAQQFGLRGTGEGWIRSDQISAAHLPTCVAMIAECSLSVDELLRKIARRQAASRDFKEEVNGELRRGDGAPAVMRRKHFFGASNKQHTFDFLIELSGDRSLVVDAVVPDANSINSAVVSHLDLRQASNPRILQRIVYDDRADWQRSDLALLSVGAPAVPFSRLHEQVSHLVH